MGTSKLLEFHPRGAGLESLNMCYYIADICIKVDSFICGKDDSCSPQVKVLLVGGNVSSLESSLRGLRDGCSYEIKLSF